MWSDMTVGIMFKNITLAALIFCIKCDWNVESAPIRRNSDKKQQNNRKILEMGRKLFKKSQWINQEY